MVLRDNGEIEGAVKCLERAVELKPDVHLFQQALAGALEQFGDFARAIGHQTCAWLLAGLDATQLDTLASMLSALGRPEAADELRHFYPAMEKSGGATTSTIAEGAHLQALALNQLGKAQDALTEHELAAS